MQRTRNGFISFDETLDELRVKNQSERSFATPWAKTATAGSAHKIALSTKHITWTDYYGKDQEGETIVARVIPANAYAEANGGEPTALARHPDIDLDDEIPF